MAVHHLVQLQNIILRNGDRVKTIMDDIQHINGRYNDALKEGYQTLTILYKDGLKVTIPASEYDRLYKCWEARRNGKSNF